LINNDTKKWPAMDDFERRDINAGEGLLIHIGMPKCASSWLQKKLFVEEVNFFSEGSDLESSIRNRIGLIRELIPENTPYFDKQKCLNYFLKYLIFPAFKKEMIPVFSHERLSGLQIVGSFDRVMIAERLNAVFPKAKVLIIIREQNDLILSSYLQYVKGGGILSLKRYMTQKWVAPYLPKHNLDQFDFQKLVSLYTELFGLANVLFLPYEVLNKAPEKFVQRIKKFSESESTIDSTYWEERINQTSSFSNLAIRRKLNRFVYPNSSWISQGAFFFTRKIRRVWPFLKLPKYFDRRIERKLKNEIDNYVQDAFVESNRELQKITDIDLVDLGYKM
jgi:hypothetical protein